MILGVYQHYEDLKWSNLSDSEIGFYHKDKKTRCEFFFGIWYDLWEHYEIPLCMTFAYDGHAPLEWHNRVKAKIRLSKTPGIRIESYQDFTCILFEYEYFKFDDGDDINRLSILYNELVDYGISIAII